MIGGTRCSVSWSGSLPRATSHAPVVWCVSCPARAGHNMGAGRTSPAAWRAPQVREFVSCAARKFQEAKIALGLLGALGLRSIGPLDPEDVLGAELGVGLNTGTASGGISPMNRQKLPNLPNAAFRAPQRTRNTHQAHVPGHEPVIYFPNKQLDQPKCTKTFPQPASWLLCGLPREVPKIVPMAVGVANPIHPKHPEGRFPTRREPVGYPESPSSGNRSLKTPTCTPKGAQGANHWQIACFGTPCLGLKRGFQASARRMGPFHVANQCA